MTIKPNFFSTSHCVSMASGLAAGAAAASVAGPTAIFLCSAAAFVGVKTACEKVRDGIAKKIASAVDSAHVKNTVADAVISTMKTLLTGIDTEATAKNAMIQLDNRSLREPTALENKMADLLLPSIMAKLPVALRASPLNKAVAPMVRKVVLAYLQNTVTSDAGALSLLGMIAGVAAVGGVLINKLTS